MSHLRRNNSELAWRMVDEEVAYLSPSTVYRILREADPRGDREGDASGRAVGHGPDVRESAQCALLLPGVHRRVFAVHCALGVVGEHGRTQPDGGEPGGAGAVTTGRSGKAAGKAGDSERQRERVPVEGVSR